MTLPPELELPPIGRKPRQPAADYRARWERRRDELLERGRQLRNAGDDADATEVAKFRAEIADFAAVPKPGERGAPTARDWLSEPKLHRDRPISEAQLTRDAHAGQHELCAVCASRKGVDLAPDGRLICRSTDCRRRVREASR